MRERSRRQEIILSLLLRTPGPTQEELLSELRRRGVELTQSTLSRELKALGIAKGPDGRGGYRYVAGGPGTGGGTRLSPGGRFRGKRGAEPKPSGRQDPSRKRPRGSPWDRSGRLVRGAGHPGRRRHHSHHLPQRKPGEPRGAPPEAPGPAPP